MLQVLFHTWERRLASVTTDRVVRPFEWGLEWIPHNGQPDGSPHQTKETCPEDLLRDWVAGVMANTDEFFSSPPTDDYIVQAVSDVERLLTFPSALVTPHPENNRVNCRQFLTRRQASMRSRGPAVLVLPQWNADIGGHVGLCRLLFLAYLEARPLGMPLLSTKA